MTATKSERLLNLVVLLLVSRNYVSKERIRDVIEPYHGSSDDAFEKMFERDKDDLRAIGVPLETGYLDKFFEDEQGYRIKRDAFELPEIDLAPDEVAVIGLAARVWEHAGLASATADALMKLRAAGYDVDRGALDALQPRLVADDPGFDALWDATITQTSVRFDYRRPQDSEPTERQIEPWAVVTANGRWYVVGNDLDRNAPRSFRLSRITSAVAVNGSTGSFEVPAGTDIRALTASLVPAPVQGVATVLARVGAAHGLRVRSKLRESDVPGPDGNSHWDRIEVPFRAPEHLAGEVLRYGDAVVVEEPEELREQVIHRLRSILARPATPEQMTR